MSSVADRLGLGPTREEKENPDGTWLVTVTPPAWSHFPAKPKGLTLTKDQYERFKRWQEGPQMIQDALPDLSSAQREYLMSGL